MEIEEIISEYGLDRALSSFFPNLSGIDISKVIYDKESQKSNPLTYLTSDVDGDWYFAIGSMPMIFKSFSKDKYEIELKKLLLSNQISIDDKYNQKGHNDIEFWDGDGFKIEKTNVKDVVVILITNADVIPKSSQTFNLTDLAQPIDKELEWIEGFDVIYNSDSIDNDKKVMSNFINVPILFQENIDYILIPVQNIELARVIIDRVIKNNGGFISFVRENLVDNKDWSYTFKGYTFLIGFLAENRVVRINRLKDNEDQTKNSLITIIHPLSKKLIKCINGFNNQLFLTNEEDIYDGRFVTKDEDATDIYALFESPTSAIKIFKEIVVEYNNKDEFLNISDESLIKLFSKESNGIAIFDVENKFRIDLIKVNENFKLNLFPPGGIYGSWNDLNDHEFSGETPKVKFSHFDDDIKTRPILTNNDKNKIAKNDESKNQEKEKFLENSVIGEDDVTAAVNNSKKSNFSFGNLFAIILFFLLLVLVIRQCNPNQDYFQRGVNYFNKGKSQKGFKYLDKAIKKDNQHMDALMRRGREYMNVNEYKNAEYDFSEVISIDPNNWEAYYLRGRSYMKQAHNKWSPLYKKAIEDFTTSISLESSSVNANSFYYRGESKEISRGEKTGCADFVDACDRGKKEGCSRYDALCYPETGYMPYKKYFGPGVFNGNNKLTLNNTAGEYDYLVSIINENNVRVRCQFIRKGDIVEMEKIPNGRYNFKVIRGHNWIFDILMGDGRTRGGFSKDHDVLKLLIYFDLYNGSERGIKFDVVGGDIESENITQKEFMN